MSKKRIKPMLMQFAEPEYMCKCGYKMYVYPNNLKPTCCVYCGEEFDWSEYHFKTQ